MKKHFMYWTLALLWAGFIACSGEEGNLSEEGSLDEGGTGNELAYWFPALSLFKN